LGLKLLHGLLYTVPGYPPRAALAAPVSVAATPSGSWGSWVGTGGTHAGAEPEPELAAATDVVAPAELVVAAGAAELDVALAADVAAELLEFDELPHAATATATSTDNPRARTVRPATTLIEIPSPSLRTSGRKRLRGGRPRSVTGGTVLRCHTGCQVRSSDDYEGVIR
jgi:hypothetical protein